MGQDDQGMLALTPEKLRPRAVNRLRVQRVRVDRRASVILDGLSPGDFVGNNLAAATRNLTKRFYSFPNHSQEPNT